MSSKVTKCQLCRFLTLVRPHLFFMVLDWNGPGLPCDGMARTRAVAYQFRE
jgi:hypothetical protein